MEAFVHFNYQNTLEQVPANMVFIGLLFCDTCGNLLPRADRNKVPQITCDLCETVTSSM